MFINREFTPMINKFLIESFVNGIIEQEIEESLFYKKYQYSKKLVETVTNSTGLHPDTISSFLDKRRKKVKTFFDLEPTPEHELIESKVERLKFILEGFDFEGNANIEVRNKIIKKHNRQYLNLLFESGFNQLLLQTDNVKDVFDNASTLLKQVKVGDEFHDLTNRSKNLKQLLAYHITLNQEIIDCAIEEIETTKSEIYITDFGEYNFIISNRVLQSILKYKAPKEVGISRVRQLKTLRQKAGKFKIQIRKTEGSKFTGMNLKDLLTTTKEREAYEKSIHEPLLIAVKKVIKSNL